MPEPTLRELIDIRTEVARSLAERQQLLDDSAHAGQFDPGRLQAIDERLRERVGPIAELLDPCDADPDVPLVLLPVRLETRYSPDGSTVQVRIFPDDVHVDLLDRGIDDTERAAAESYWTAVWGADPTRCAQAWTGFLARVHPRRAGWVAAATTPTNLADRATASAPPRLPPTAARLRRGARARALPDRFVAVAVQGDRRSDPAVGAPVPPEVALGLVGDVQAPADRAVGGLRLPAGAEWLADPDRARAVGLLLDVTLPIPGGDVDRLVVVGTRTSLDPAAGAAELADLLSGHRYADGLGLIAPGTPSNNTDARRSPYSPRPTPQPPPLDPQPVPEEGSDAAVVAAVLGVDPTVFAGVEGAGARNQPLAHAANTLLWQPGWGDFLDRLAGAGAAVGYDDAARERVRSFSLDRVRGRGPAPTVRIGRQPYGVLPASSLDRWQPRDGFSTVLVGVLRELRRRWLHAAEAVPHLAAADGQVDETLLAVMGTAPVSQSLRVRPVLGADAATVLAGAVGAAADLYPVESTFSTMLLLDVVAGGDRLRVPGSLAEKSRPLPLPLADDTDPDYVEGLLTGHPTGVRSVLQAVAALAWRAAQDAIDAASPPGRLLDTVRLADLPDSLRAQVDSVAEHASGGVPDIGSGPFGRLADELSAQVGEAGPALLAVHEPIPALRTSLADLAAGQVDRLAGVRLAVSALGAWARASAHQAQLRDALRTLAGAGTDERTLVVAESLDCASHRLDAWVTGLIEDRRVDASRPTPELTIGAYGIVEGLRRGSGGTSDDGWLLAPGLDGAATAGLLRSAHLAHRGDDGGPGAFAIDLSSARVRRGRHLLDGVRQGQPLGALLGYRIERAITEADAGRFILSLRTLAPLAAPRPADPGPASTPAVAATDVVDGLVLTERYAADPAPLRALLAEPPVDNPYLDGTPWRGPTDPEWAALTAALTEAADAVDAVADLLLAEQVHHLAAGNTARAAAALDAASTGAAAVELDVLRSTAMSERLAHRILLLGADGAGWGVASPRALAEPRLEGWAAARLGDPRQIVVADQGGELVTLAGRGLAALDLIYGSADRRTLDRLVRGGLPGDVPFALRRDPRWAGGLRAYGEAVELAVSLRRLLVGARPLTPADLVRPTDRPTRRYADLAADRARAAAAAGGLATRAAALASALDGSDPPDPEALASAVDGLAPYGVTVPVDAPGRTAGRLLLAEARRRGTVAGVALAAADPTDAAVADAIAEAGEAVFGDGFRILPVLAAPTAADAFADGFAASDGAGGGPSRPTLRRGIRDAGSVRSSMARYAEALLIGDGLDRPARLRGVQLTGGPPGGAPDPIGWLAGDLGSTRWPDGPVAALVVDGPPELTGTSALAGLVVDSWSEALPGQLAAADAADAIAGRTQLGLAVHSATASARAPQAILVAVSPDGQRWTREALMATVEETLDLAKARAVTLETAAGDARLLPALYLQSWSLQGTPAFDLSALVAVARSPASYVNLAPYVKEST